MQPSFKKLEVFFSGTETSPYTHHLNHKSWILLPLVSIGILSLILVRDLSAPERENQCPIKQRRHEIGLLAALCWETDWGCSFCRAFLWSQHQQIREQFHAVAPCNLPVYNFQETHLKALLDYSKQERQKQVWQRLPYRPLITSSFLLFLPRASPTLQWVFPCIPSAHSAGLLQCVLSKEAETSSGSTIHTHFALQPRSCQCNIELGWPPAKFST